MPILAQGPELGLDSLVQPNLLDPRAAAERSQSVFYEYGLISTPWGFAKLDLTSGLNSGDPVLAVFPYREIDGFDHLIAATTQKIYDHDTTNEDWDDKTQSGVTMRSSIDNPMSWTTIGHDDSDIYLDDDTTKAHAYYHIVVCNGGIGDIQRWAGRRETDFADLIMTAGDYGGTTQTTHRALQVSTSQQNRMILLSPQEFNSSTNQWSENNQMVRWPQISKLQSWYGAGAGFVNLQDTGGLNVWSASLGAQHIIYQTNGIWTLNYVGGTTVFSPTPAIPDIGLLSPHLLISYDNVHYFIGTDLNVYAYFGGSVKQAIGDPIHKYLQTDLDKQYKNRMWMAMGPNRRRLWIFIVEHGSQYITKAYYRNMQTGAWGVRDFTNKFNSTTGITAVSLIGGQTITTGDSYSEALDTLSSYSGESGDKVEQRYGDVLIDTSRSLTIDISAGDWDDGGLKFTKVGWDCTNDITENDILKVEDGSDGVNTWAGTHFYTVFDVTNTKFSVRPRFSGSGLRLEFTSIYGNAYQPQLGDTITEYTSGTTALITGIVVQSGSFKYGDATGYFLISNPDISFNGGVVNADARFHINTNTFIVKAAADTSTVPRLGGTLGIADLTSNQPDINSAVAHDGADAVFYAVNSGETYRDVIQENETKAQLLMGDATGLVYYMDETCTTDDGSLIDARHYTPVFDLAEIGKNKRWPGSRVVAEGTAGGAMKVSYRTSQFDTSDTGWTDFSFDLTAEMIEKEFHTNVTSKKIQWKFGDWSGNQFSVREFELKDPQIQDDR